MWICRIISKRVSLTNCWLPRCINCLLACCDVVADVRWCCSACQWTPTRCTPSCGSCSGWRATTSLPICLRAWADRACFLNWTSHSASRASSRSLLSFLDTFWRTTALFITAWKRWATETLMSMQYAHQQVFSTCMLLLSCTECAILLQTLVFITLSPAWAWIIVILHVCLSVCLFLCIKIFYILPVTIAQSSSDNSAVQYFSFVDQIMFWHNGAYTGNYW